MSTSPSKNNKKILPVYGWIREAEREIEYASSSTLKIPKVIQEIMVLYYAKSDNIKKAWKDFIKMSNNNRVITKFKSVMDENYGITPSYGGFKINTNNNHNEIIEWSMKINNAPLMRDVYDPTYKSCNVLIGICTDEIYDYKFAKFLYGIEMHFTEISNIMYEMNSEVSRPMKEICDKIKINDTIKMILDLKQRKLKFSVDDEGVCTINDICIDIDLEYRLLIGLETIGSCVEII